jgi:hypothetical protein
LKPTERGSLLSFSDHLCSVEEMQAAGLQVEMAHYRNFGVK